MAKYRTIAVKPETYDRFEAYKFRAMTADELLNWFMDRVTLRNALDEFAEEHLGRAAMARTRPKKGRRH